MKNCPKCGASYEDDALFCEKCGTSLSGLGRVIQMDEEAETVQDVDDSPSTVMAESQDSKDASSAMAAGGTPQQKPAKKKGGKKGLIWTLVILLLLGALGGGGYYLYSEGMLDDILGTHQKKADVDDEDDEDEDEDEDDEDDVDEYADNEDFYEDDDEDVSDSEEAAIENVSIEEPVIEEEPATPAPRQETPAPRQETPAPRQQTPTPRQETPAQPVQQQTPAQPVQQQTPTPRTNVTPVTPPQPTVTYVTVTSNIPRAMIIIDGVDVGWAPWSGELTPGMHTFAMKAKNKEKLRTSDFTLNITGRSMTVPINVPDPSVFE